MIHGEGVMSKYGAILAGFQAELYQGIPYAEREQKNDELLKFIDMVRNSTREEFEEWYELYR